MELEHEPLCTMYGVAQPVCTALLSASMEKRALAEKFGVLVRRLRVERGFSQEAFAQACEVERVHMGKIERGEVNVTVATTLRLVAGLDLSLSDFFSKLEQELDGTCEEEGAD